MTYQLNQFKLSDQVGEVMNPNPSTISARLVSTLSGNVQAGYVVKLSATEAGQLPVVDAAASGDEAIGVVLFNAKKATYVANDIVEIALIGSIITMVAGAAMNRNVNVSWNSVSKALQSTTSKALGKTLSIASTNGDIVQVLIAPQLVLS